MTAQGGDLSTAIAALRSDLQDAVTEGQGKDVQFGLGEVELTLQLASIVQAS